MHGSSSQGEGAKGAKPWYLQGVNYTVQNFFQRQTYFDHMIRRIDQSNQTCIGTELLLQQLCISRRLGIG